MSQTEIELALRLVEAKRDEQFYYIALLAIALSVVIVLILWRILQQHGRRFDETVQAIKDSRETDEAQNKLLTQVSAGLESSIGVLQGTGSQLALVVSKIDTLQSKIEHLWRDADNWHRGTRNHMTEERKQILSLLDEHARSQHTLASTNFEWPFPGVEGIHRDWVQYRLISNLESGVVHIYQYPTIGIKGARITDVPSGVLAWVIERWWDGYHAVRLVGENGAAIEGYLYGNTVSLEPVEESNQIEDEVLVIEDNN